MFPSDVLLEWLDLKWPNWFPFLSAVSLGLLGVLALSFIIVFFAPDTLFFWMILITLFSGSSTGYTFWQKRRPQSRLSLVLHWLTAGLLIGAGATALQMVVDAKLFLARTSPVLVGTYLLCGPLGAGLGGLLRRQYEKTSGPKGQVN